MAASLAQRAGGGPQLVVGGSRGVVSRAGGARPGADGGADVHHPNHRDEHGTESTLLDPRDLRRRLHRHERHRLLHPGGGPPIRGRDRLHGRQRERRARRRHHGRPGRYSPGTHLRSPGDPALHERGVSELPHFNAARRRADGALHRGHGSVVRRVGLQHGPARRQGQRLRVQHPGGERSHRRHRWDPIDVRRRAVLHDRGPIVGAACRAGSLSADLLGRARRLGAHTRSWLVVRGNARRERPAVHASAEREHPRPLGDAVLDPTQRLPAGRPGEHPDADRLEWRGRPGDGRHARRSDRVRERPLRPLDHADPDYVHGRIRRRACA